MTKKDKNPEEPASYTKARLLASRRYAHRRDLLAALLRDGGRYTVEQVDAKIEKYLKGVM